MNKTTEKDKKDLSLLTGFIQAFMQQGYSRQIAVAMATEKFKELKLKTKSEKS